MAARRRVTQLAAHSITDGKRSDALHGDFCEEGTGAVAQLLPQFWRAGDVGSIRTMAGLSNSMTEFDNRRTVTVSSPQPFGYQQNGTIHASGPLWNEME